MSDASDGFRAEESREINGASELCMETGASSGESQGATSRLVGLPNAREFLTVFFLM